MVPAPLLDAAVEKVGTAIDRLIPPEWQMALSAAAGMDDAPTAMRALADQLVTSLNEQIDLPMLNEEQEAVLLRAAVDQAIAQLTVPGTASSDPVTRLKLLHERQRQLTEQIAQVKDAAAQQVRYLDGQLAQVRLDIKKATAEAQRAAK